MTIRTEREVIGEIETPVLFVALQSLQFSALWINANQGTMTGFSNPNQALTV